MDNPTLLTRELRIFGGETLLSLEAVHTSHDTFLAAGSKNGVVRTLLLGSSAQTINTLQFGEGDETNVRVRAISRRGNVLACAGSNKTLALYDSASCQPLFKFPDTMLSASPFNCKLYGSSWLFANIGSELHLFNVSNPEAVSRRAVFRTHSHKVTGLAISKGANPLVVTTSWDHKVFLHVLGTMTSYQVNCNSAANVVRSEIPKDVRNQSPALTYGRFPIPMRTVDISDDGERFAVGGYGKHVWMFKRSEENPPKYKQEYSILVEDTRYVYAIKICTATNSLIVGGAPHSLKILSLTDGAEKRDLSHHYVAPIRCLLTNPEGTQIITAGEDGRIVAHDCATEDNRFTLATTSARLRVLPDTILQNIRSFLIHEQPDNEDEFDLELF